MTIYSVVVNQNLTVGNPQTVGVRTTVRESGKASSTLATVLGVTINAHMTGTTAQAKTYIGGGVLAETGKLHDALGPQSKFSATLSVGGVVSGALNVARLLKMSETSHIALALAAGVGVTVQERAHGLAALASQGTYHVTEAEYGHVHDALARYVGAQLTETGHLHVAQTPTYVGVVNMIAHMIMTGYLYERLVFSVMLADAGYGADTLTPKMLFNAQLMESAQVTLAYVGPSNGITAWAMNTRTNALTEYRNWNFNSFAAIGRKYIAANANGLYELNGERDVTTNIVADMAGGMTAFNGAKLAGLKGVYIGMNNQGQYFLKLTAGDGRYYMYQFTTNPGRMTSKVITGKGLRSRYFQWELISTGSDFDLDSIEFVPMVSDRRVNG